MIVDDLGVDGLGVADAAVAGSRTARGGAPVGKPSELIQGTLDLLVLKTVSLEPKHGWAIAKRIEQGSGNVLQVTQGALYPALHRLERQGWLRAEWRATETGREAKFYALTAAGRARLDDEIAQWDRLSTAVGLVIRMV
jgi:PadR family transcriptional regulator, regulatory protein PadR